MKKSREYSNPVRIYLKQIEHIPVLTREEEEICARKASMGDEKEKERLIVSNLRFVVSIALKYQNLGLPLMDLINEGNMGLIRAVEKFDVNNPFEGVRGKIAFTSNHDLVWGDEFIRNYICQWQEGKQVILYPKNKATGQFVKPEWI